MPPRRLGVRRRREAPRRMRVRRRSFCYTPHTMFDYRQKIAGGRLLAFWEPGLFALPGMLFIWAALVALHRIAYRGFDGSRPLVFACVVILIAAGVALLGGRWGVVFAPGEKRWGVWVGIFRPLVVRWRPLHAGARVALTVEHGMAADPFFLVRLMNGHPADIGATADPQVAAAATEGLASFLGLPLECRDGARSETFDGPPHWGALATLAGRGGDGRRFTGKEVTLPAGRLGMRGRGPLLLAAFLAAIAGVNWTPLEMGRSLWGVAACVWVACFCLWAVPYALDCALRSGRIAAGKDGLSIAQRGLLRRAAAVAWDDLVYLSLVPARKGFLGLSGRPHHVCVGWKSGSTEVGEHLSDGDLVELHRFIAQHARKRGR